MINPKQKLLLCIPAQEEKHPPAGGIELGVSVSEEYEECPLG